MGGLQGVQVISDGPAYPSGGFQNGGFQNGPVYDSAPVNGSTLPVSAPEYSPAGMPFGMRPGTPAPAATKAPSQSSLSKAVSKVRRIAGKNRWGKK
jgi:hypothetical protein